MNHRFILVLMLNALLLSTTLADERSFKSFTEKNNLWISDQEETDNDMSKELFNKIIDKIESVYSPIVSQNRGKLKIIRKWKDGTVNAYASKRGRTRVVTMFGGLARHKSITPDGFALVVCHELGHHLGGVPKMPDMRIAWATNEGQSDYYATLKCMRKVFVQDNNSEIVASMKIPTVLSNLCAEQFTDLNEQYLCQRSAMAGLSLANLLKELKNETTSPSFMSKDPNIVNVTQHMHPATQCRLDTYLAGALCSISDTQNVSYRDEAAGVCYRANGDKNGTRPLCWFKPSRD